MVRDSKLYNPRLYGGTRRRSGVLEGEDGGGEEGKESGGSEPDEL